MKGASVGHYREHFHRRWEKWGAAFLTCGVHERQGVHGQVRRTRGSREKRGEKKKRETRKRKKKKGTGKKKIPSKKYIIRRTEKKVTVETHYYDIAKKKKKVQKKMSRQKSIPLFCNVKRRKAFTVLFCCSFSLRSWKEYNVVGTAPWKLWR